MVVLNGSRCSPWDGGKCHRGHRCAKRANSTGSFLNDQPHDKGQGVPFILTGSETSELWNCFIRWLSLYEAQKCMLLVTWLVACLLQSIIRGLQTLFPALVVHVRLCRSLLFRMIVICLCMFAVCTACNWGY